MAARELWVKVVEGGAVRFERLPDPRLAYCRTLKRLTGAKAVPVSAPPIRLLKGQRKLPASV